MYQPDPDYNESKDYLKFSAEPHMRRRCRLCLSLSHASFIPQGSDQAELSAEVCDFG